MDQYVINLELPILYFDLLELIELIEGSQNEELLPYVEQLREVFNDHTPRSNKSENIKD